MGDEFELVLRVFRDLIGWERGDPASRRIYLCRSTCLPPASCYIVARSEPEKSLRSDDSSPFAVRECPESFRMEWSHTAIDKTRDPVLLCLWSMIMVSTTCEFSHPERAIFCFFHREESRIYDLIEMYLPPISLDIFRCRLESLDDRSECFFLILRDFRYLIHHDYISEFDLIDEKIDDRPIIFFSYLPLPISEEIR